jgi:hypothetical protein
LLRALERAPREATAAEVTRAVGELAWAIDLPRPSYQQVRVLLAAARVESDRVTTMDVLIDICIGTRPGWDLANRMYGDPLPWRLGAKNEPR